MDARKNSKNAPSIRVTDMEKSLDFYTKTLGFKATDKMTLKNGKVAMATVGFDSPLLMLAPVEYVRTPQTKDDLIKNKLGIGVDFHIGLNGTKKLDDFFAEVKSKGITVVSEPKTEFWGDRVFTLKDPDGYHLTFSEHVRDVTPEAMTAGFETTHAK